MLGRAVDGDLEQEQGSPRALHQVEGDFGPEPARMSLLRFYSLYRAPTIRKNIISTLNRSTFVMFRLAEVRTNLVMNE